jgi:enamine deaminase RidA (YjgF/YER057c/UK114 family)
MSGDVEEKLRALGVSLPEMCVPRANFLPYRVEGNLAFMSGQVCEWNGDMLHSGPVIGDGQDAPFGPSVSLETGRAAARICVLNLLFHLKAACAGDFTRLRNVVRVGGFVNCCSGFVQAPIVINAASDLLIEVFGEAGRHARTAVGVNGLPGDASVEIEAIFALN